jgi:hypothetical protein
MSPIEVLEETRKEHHRGLELRIRAELVGGPSVRNPQNLLALNPENVRQGLNKVMGVATAYSGVAYALCEEIRIVEEGPGLAVGFPDETPLFEAEITEPGVQVSQRFGLLTKLKPGKLFGREQAIQFVSLAGGPLYEASFAKAMSALDESTGYEDLAWIVSRLVEERLRLTDGKRNNEPNKPRAADRVVTAILEAVAAGKGAGEGARWDTVERARVALREVSARYYTEYYHAEDVFTAGDALLDSVSDPGRRRVVEDSVSSYAAERSAMFAVVVSRPEARRGLYEIIEGLFESGRLNRPAVVLSEAELPSEMALPRSKGEIRPSA